MTKTTVLVTAATGRIGGAVATQLLEKGITTRAMVHRNDARSARLRDLGAEIVVADMFDIQQVQAAMDEVDRLYFNPPYHPHALDSAVTFALAARRSGVEAVVAMGQWLASPEHPSLMARHAWLTDKLFELLPNTAHVAVDPGFFADNYFTFVPVAAQLGVFPLPTGPTLLTGAEIADAVGEALGRRLRHIDVPPWMVMRAVHVNAKRHGFDLFFESWLRHALPEYALGTWEVGGPTTHVRDVAGVEPEDFLTIARRYVTGREWRRTAGNLIRQISDFTLTGLVPMHRLDKFEQRQQHPQPAHPRYSGESAVWRSEHPAPDRRAARPFPAVEADPASA
jgi:NAD(P)H dehydrogenase (quinone)